jgi:[acyl-carrier-protein] S-malonyltransferase
MKRAFVFPGQGSQAPGMGRALADAFPAARLLFEEVDDALSQHLSRLMFDGPERELMLTEHAQPALLAVSLAVLRVLEAEAGFDIAAGNDKGAAYVAGHSLGEYSALAAARAFSLADAVRLVKRRGRAMQEAVPVGEGAMAALLGLDLAAAREICAAAAGSLVCALANDNSPGQIVVSGHTASVERAAALAGERRARAIMLPVSAPFHCPLMAPVAEVMREALEETPPRTPVAPLVANVTAAATQDPEEIGELLIEQVTRIVRWRETIELFAANAVEEVVELGAGRVLTGLTRRIDRELAAVSVGTPDDLDALVKRL